MISIFKKIRQKIFKPQIQERKEKNRFHPFSASRTPTKTSTMPNIAVEVITSSKTI